MSLPGPFRPLLPLLLVSLLLPSCSRPAPVNVQRFLPGGLTQVTAWGDPGRAGELRAAAEAALDRMGEAERILDPRVPGGPSSLLRRGETALLPPEMAATLRTALAVAEASGGAFDPTVGEILSLWGWDVERPVLPAEEAVRAALPRVGHRRLRLAGDTAVPAGPVFLDLGGVGEGAAVDEGVRVLEERGVDAGVVDSAGDLRAFGRKPDGKPWRIGVAHPDRPQELLGVVTLQAGAAVMTSGDYQAFFLRDGVRYHHIIDPATGFPARGLRSVTIIGPGGAVADALATAVFVLGVEKGTALVGRFPGYEAVLVREGGEVVLTPGLEEGGPVGWEETPPR